MRPRLSKVLLITTALGTAALVGLSAPPGAAGPQGPSVVGGAATVTGAGTASVTVNQTSPSTIINWNTFNIGANERVNFVQPSSSSIALNRVTGGLGPSEILGTLTANGRVFVINRDGVLIGPNAVITTGSFLATTHDIRNEDFMHGRMNFNIPGRPDASIVNLGRITATSGGFAALVAPGVRNSGTITATLGTVGLAASGNGFTLDMYGDRLITLSVSDQVASKVIDVATGHPLKSLVTNTGTLRANGGRVELTAAAARAVVDSVINTSGVIQANSIGRRNGMIVLSAGTAGSKPEGAPVQTIRISGTVSAAGKRKGTSGGTVVVSGENIQVANARIDASGKVNGGKVLIGGDWGGGKPKSGLVDNQSAKLETFVIPTASTVSIDGNSTINASSTGNGNGGKVILWSEQQTTFAGTILANGGPNGGNGGFVETSSRGQLNFTGNVNTLAPNGRAGTLLLDPENYYINTPGTAPGGDPTASAISVGTLVSLLNGGNVVIATLSTGGNAGDIFVQNSVAWTGSNSLTLSANRNIEISPGVTISNVGAGNLVLRADNAGTGTGTVLFPGFADAGRVDFTQSTGKVSIYYNPVDGYSEPTNYGTFVSTNGSVSNQLTAYMLVNSANDFQNIASNLDGTYALGKSFSLLDFHGFAPGTTFTGTFDGNGGLGVNYKLTDVSLSSSSSPIGLFPFIGATGTVRNLDLDKVTITAGGNTQFVGVVAGVNAGTISNVRVLHGTVDGGSYYGIAAGGLVGQNTGTITGSSSAATVTVGNGCSIDCSGGGTNYAGGLVGNNLGTITNSSASGPVAGGTFSFVGGLAGANSNSINSSYATGSVSGTSDSNFNNGAIGGLVGDSSGSITASYATGSVSGSGNFNSIGGLAGSNSGSISGSYATGAVSSSDGSSTGTVIAMGGLVGSNRGSIESSYATGSVSAASFGPVGGLVGVNETGGSISNSFTTASVILSAPSGGYAAGGLVGENGGLVTSSYAAGSVVAGNNNNYFGGPVGGLVGFNWTTGVISNSFTTANVTLSGPNGGWPVGGLAGRNSGLITDSYAAGSLVAGNNIYSVGPIGGLVGINDFSGTISNSFATGSITLSALNALWAAGGLVGANGGVVTGSYATGSVVAANNYGPIGGLVGLNLATGIVFNSFATGNITLSGSNGGFAVGGLVGENAGHITSSYATGSLVAGNNFGPMGGLVGLNSNTGVVSDSFATGNVTLSNPNGGGWVAGGLVGENDGSITNSHATGSVSASGNGANINLSGVAGGLVGHNRGTISSSFASGNVSASGAYSVAGGLVGINWGTINGVSFATGNVGVSATETGIAGGLIGINYGLVFQAYASGNVDIRGKTGIAGGFVGVNSGSLSYPFGSIDQAFATGAVTSSAVNSFIGGFIGVNDNLGAIAHAYATGAVTSNSGGVVAGFAAVNVGSLDQTFAIGKLTGGDTVGGLVGQNTGASVAQYYPFSSDPARLSGTGTATNSYWDTQTTGVNTSAGGTGVPTTGLIAALPVGFDHSVWTIQPDPSYPYFPWQGINTIPITNEPAPPQSAQLPQPQSQTQIIENLTSTVTFASLNTSPVFNTQNGGALQPQFPPPQPPPGAGQPGGQPGAGQQPLPGLPQRIFDIPPLTETRFVTDQLVAQVRCDTGVPRVEQAVRQLGLSLLASQDLCSTAGSIVLQFRITNGQDLRAIIPQLASVQIVAIAQPNYIYETVQEPAADPTAPASRGNPQQQQGDAAQYILQKLQISDVHRIVRGTNVPIAVVDSEIDASHPDLQGVIVQRFSAVGAPEKPHSHGTGMAGAIASHQRLMGIAPSARLYAVHAFSSKATTAESTTFNILKGLDWAQSQNVRIINMSFAGPKDPSLERSLKAAYDKGIVLIAAAGNAGPKSPPLYPGADPNVIAVTATDAEDKIFSGANRGKYISVAAPGVDILVPAPEGAYQLTTGTSVAAAEVSGIAALLLERNPRLTPVDIRRILTGSAKRLGAGERNDDFGSGLVDVLKALQSADPRVVTTPTLRQR